MTLSNQNVNPPPELTADIVASDNYVLNQLKRQFLEATGVFGAFEVEELGIIWEHELHAPDPDAGNGITDKFFEYDDANVTRSGPDVDVEEGGFIRTRERGDYGAGKQAIPGCAGRWNQDPVGDQDAWMGYYDDSNGIGAGVGYKHFNAGESGASEAGAQFYAFFEVGGEGREVVPAENFNVDALDGSGVAPTLDPTDGITLRMPGAAYGHSRLGIMVGIKTDDADADSISSFRDAFTMYPAHVFTKPGETMWDEFDLPIEWNTSGTQSNGFVLKATACHYQGDLGRKLKRVSGEGFTPQKNGGTAISLNTFPDWTYLLSFRKRTGWEGVDVSPLGVSINTDQNIEVQITVGGDFNNTSYALPDDTAATEGAVEYDIKTWDLANDTEKTEGDTAIGTDRGRREWYDTVPGDKQEPVNVEASLDNVVLSGGDALALLARPATSTATVVNYAALRNGSNF